MKFEKWNIPATVGDEMILEFWRSLVKIMPGDLEDKLIVINFKQKRCHVVISRSDISGSSDDAFRIILDDRL